MKKQQLKKLLKNFRPSMEQTKNRLFRELENKARNQYQMPIKVYTYKNRKNELFIEFLGQTAKDKILSVPLDKNFDIVIKRIQNEEAGLFDRFSSNLVEEIVTYWYQSPKSSSTQDTKVEPQKKIKKLLNRKIKFKQKKLRQTKTKIQLQLVLVLLHMQKVPIKNLKKKSLLFLNLLLERQMKKSKSLNKQQMNVY